eukprot:scaffold12766_cov117-Isochrysis_galbana.AAC.3
MVESSDGRHGVTAAALPSSASVPFLARGRLPAEAGRGAGPSSTRSSAGSVSSAEGAGTVGGAGRLKGCACCGGARDHLRCRPSDSIEEAKTGGGGIRVACMSERCAGGCAMA